MVFLRKDTPLFHKVFGYCTVASVSHKDGRITVCFDSFGEKTFKYPDAIGVFLHYINIKDFVIKDNVLLKYKGAASDVIIPPGVISIGEKVFEDNESITSLALPNTVLQISEKAFNKCSSLESIFFSEGLQIIGKFAFAKCYSLQEVKFPMSLRSIGEGAFSECKSLKKVTLSSGISIIPSDAFSNCTSLSYVSNVKTIKGIEQNAFFSCESLSHIAFGEQLESIGKRAFAFCDSLSEIKIPNPNTAFEASTFASCLNLTITAPSESLVHDFCDKYSIHFRPTDEILYYTDTVNNLITQQSVSKSEGKRGVILVSGKNKNRLMRVGAFLCFLFLAYSFGLTSRLYHSLQNTIEGHITSDRGIYVGETSFGLMEGEGVFEFNTGEEYRGSWKNDTFDGNGNLIFSDGSEYVGYFESGSRSGKGVYRWSNGDEYSGEWDNDLPNGEGTLTFADGTMLIGSFQNGDLVEGVKRTVTDSYVFDYIIADESENAYEVRFYDGTRLGYDGSEYAIDFINGDKYEGKLDSDFRFMGNGAYFWNNGAIYKGNWVDGKAEGNGTFFWGKYTYAGSFEDFSLMDGNINYSDNKSTISYKVSSGKTNGEMSITCPGTGSFSGTSDIHSLTGSGTFSYLNKDNYSGKYKNGKRSGSGLYRWSNGDTYEGSWDDDKMSGSGTYTFKTGSKIVGNFKNNKPNGYCTFYTSDGSKYSTYWEDGVMLRISEG